jgi:hypothetical protein
MNTTIITIRFDAHGYRYLEGADGVCVKYLPGQQSTPVYYRIDDMHDADEWLPTVFQVADFFPGQSEAERWQMVNEWLESGNG